MLRRTSQFQKLYDEHKEKRPVDDYRDVKKRATPIRWTAWFHHDRSAAGERERASERRGTCSHEIRQHNDPNTGFPILASDPTSPSYTQSPAFHSALNCPKEEGEGRYESTYLLAFVQRAALSERVLELLTSSTA